MSELVTTVRRRFGVLRVYDLNGLGFRVAAIPGEAFLTLKEHGAACGSFPLSFPTCSSDTKQGLNSQKAVSPEYYFRSMGWPKRPKTPKAL